MRKLALAAMILLSTACNVDTKTEAQNTEGMVSKYMEVSSNDRAIYGQFLAIQKDGMSDKFEIAGENVKTVGVRTTNKSCEIVELTANNDSKSVYNTKFGVEQRDFKFIRLLGGEKEFYFTIECSEITDFAVEILFSKNSN